MKIRAVQLIITILAILFALAHVFLPSLTIDGITLALFVIAILPWLAPLFKSLEFPGGWKVEFHELEKAKNKADKAGLLKKSNRKKKATIYSFESLLDKDPNLALAGLRIEIEKRLVQIAKSNKLNITRAGVGQLISLLNQHRILTPEESSALADMSNLLNSAVHGAEVDKRAADWAVEFGPKLLSGLDEKIKK